MMLFVVCFAQAEAEGFSHFHLYVCAAFLLEWRKEILSMIDFQVWMSLESYLFFVACPAQLVP